MPRFCVSNDLISEEISSNLTDQGTAMQHLSQRDIVSDKKSALYTEFAATILVYVFRLVSNRQDAEDLLLEVFMAAFSSETVLQLSAKQQLAWLRRVARNKAIDRYRHASRFTMVPLEEAGDMEDEESAPQLLAERRQAYERLSQVVAGLPPVQQELLRLRYGHDLRLNQIAEHLSKPEGTVRKLLSRTLRGLRRRYEQSESGGE